MRNSLQLGAVLAFTAAALAWAQVPSRINYQGRLVQGTNLVNGTVGMVLRIYTNATSGSYLYEDSNTVPVVDGIYSTVIGDDTTFGSLTNALTTGEAFVEIVINGTALSPRERIAAVAYAVRAGGVAPGSVGLSDLNTNSVDSQYVNVAGDTMTGPLVLPGNGLTVGSGQLVVSGGNVGIGANSPSSRVEVVGGTLSGDYVMKIYSGTNLVGWAKKK